VNVDPVGKFAATFPNIVQVPPVPAVTPTIVLELIVTPLTISIPPTIPGENSAACVPAIYHAAVPGAPAATSTTVK
jgi:hypothetical protein